MARPKGSRNAGYEERRSALARAVVPRLIQPDGVRSSFREFAQAAGCSVPTLRHYFGNRDGLVQAAFAEIAAIGHQNQQDGAQLHADDLTSDLQHFLEQLVLGWQHFGVGPMVTAGLTEGLYHPQLGATFVDQLLEPMLQVAERRLAAARDAGWIDPDAELRAAGLMLMSPILMALLHQGPLSGASCRPLDVEKLVTETVHRFVRAYQPAA